MSTRNVPCSYSEVGCKEKMYRNKMNEHEREFRDAHLNLAMKKVVSLTATVSELQERVDQLTASFKAFKEQFSVYDYIH